MKKLLLLIFLMTISLGQSQTLEGTWKMTSLGVGGSKGNTGWWGLSVSSGERACLFDDQYVFGANGTFQNVQGTQTYSEGWLGEGCGTPTSPFNGSNPATFTSNGSSVTVTGIGAYIGLPKVTNGGEINSTEAHPGTVTYQITSLTSSTLTLDINYGGGWWRFVLAKEGVAPPPSNTLKITTTVCGAAPSSVVRMVGPWWGNWSANAGPVGVNNGDETWTFTFDPAPSANMEYLILKDGVQENLIGKGDCAPITDGWSYANRKWTVGTGNVSNVYNSCSACVNFPTTDAPTPIARNAWDVKSVYSAAYSNFEGVDVFPNWGQSTTYSSYTPVNDPTIKYSNLSFQGIDFLGPKNLPKNISAMTKLHLDVWTPDITSFIVYLIAGGDNPVTLTPTLHGWNSFDIDLATQYAGRNLTSAIQLKLERLGGGTSSIYLDNIYFYRPATLQPPTLGAFTVPAKAVSAADFQLAAPTSNSTGAFTYTSSNTAVATISGSTLHIVGVGLSTITATQASDGNYAAISVIATLDVSPTAAAPTPIVSGDRVLSIFSSATGYSNVANTQFRPNWGQQTQYNLVNVVGDPTIKYSNLDYEGVQLETPIDITSYTTLHIDVYGAGTTAVDFRVINQVGGAGSSNLEHIANTALTLTPGVWNSFDIPVSSLSGLELNRVGQLMFVGSGTIYVDNIYFSKSTPSHTTAPTVANITYCKGATSQTLTAIASGTNLLKWYSTATIATALTTAPKPATTTSGTKTYYVSQVMSDGFVSPRAAITVTVTTDVTPVASATLTLNNSLAVSVTAIGSFIGTSTEFTLEASESATLLATYQWTLPIGVNQVLGGLNGGIHDRIITVKFDGVGKGITPLLISVQSTNSAGCLSDKKTLSLTRALPAAPAAIKMTDASMEVPVSGIPTAVTSFAKYMGKTTELTLTATESASVTSYVWELPTGVNITKGSATTVDGVTTSSSNAITVNLSGVTSSNTYNYSTTATVPVSTNVLRIGVKSVNGVGISTTANTALVNPKTDSTAKLLTLTAIAPATPGAITASTANVCSVVGTPTNVTYSIAPVANAYANGYTWTVPTGATIVGSKTGESISVSYSNNYITAGAVTVTASNGVGSSATAKTLAVTRVAPVAIASINGGTTYSTCDQTFSATSVANQTYTWTVPVGATIKSGQGTNSVVVNYGSLKGSQTIKVMTTNACGLSSAVKSLTLTSGSCPIVSNGRLSQSSNVSVTGMYPNPTSDSFNLELSATKSANVSVTVYSFDGIVVSSKNVKLTEGSNVLNEDLSSQREGIYLVKIIDSTTGLETIKKIIKQ